MADQAITALPKKTYSGSSQIASTDYLLGIDSAEGYQMLIQDLGEYIINRVTASLAGSNQTLAAAISALNSNTYTLEPSQSNMLANGTDILNLNNGVYFAGSNEVAVSLVNKPTGLDTNCKIIVEERIRGRKMVTVIAPYKVWVNQRVNGSEWGGWKLTPTRDEVDAINSNMSVALLPTNADANASTYRSAGFHMYAGAFSNDRTNFPSDFKGGVFIDVGTADMHWQFCCNYNSASVLYFRNYYSSWNTWKLLTNV